MNKPMIHRIYDVVLPPFRRRRMQRIDREVLDRIRPRTVVDLGGAEAAWAYSAHTPQVTLVNLDEQLTSLPNVTALVGDATATEFPDQSFDLVFSNSVIEHIGKHRWKAFAA